MTENITDNMNDAGYPGVWFSYIEGMVAYRVQYLNDVYKVFTQEMEEVKDDETKAILDRLNND